MTSRFLPSFRTWRNCSPVWKSGQTGCSATQTPGILHPHPWICPHSESAYSFLQHCWPWPTCVPTAPLPVLFFVSSHPQPLVLSSLLIWTLVFPSLEHLPCLLMFQVIFAYALVSSSLSPLSVSLFLSIACSVLFFFLPLPLSFTSYCSCSLFLQPPLECQCVRERLCLSPFYFISMHLSGYLSLLFVLWCSLSACFLSRHCSVWGGMSACTSLFHLLLSLSHQHTLPPPPCLCFIVE